MHMNTLPSRYHETCDQCDPSYATCVTPNDPAQCKTCVSAPPPNPILLRVAVL